MVDVQQLAINQYRHVSEQPEIEYKVVGCVNDEIIESQPPR